MAKIRFGIVGTGGRGLRAFGANLRQRFADDTTVVALADRDPTRLRYAAGKLGVERTYDTAAGLIADRDVDVVVITTPDATHAEIALEAIDAGKHVICEKPLATTIEDCNRVRAAAARSDHLFMVGFVLRYVPFFRTLRAAVVDGAIGTPLLVNAADNRVGADYFRRWHRLRRNSGGLLVHKSCHTLDIVNWLLDRRPVSVSATGGVAVFTPKDWAGERCLTCPAKDTCPEFLDITQGELGRMYYEAEATSGYVRDVCVFNSEKDTVDHAAVSIEYADGVRASYSLCLFASYNRREMSVWGADGKAEGSEDGADVVVTSRRNDGEDRHRVAAVEGGHAGGDLGLLADALAALKGEREPSADLEAGYWSAVLGIAAEQSVAQGGRRMDLAELGVTTDPS